MRGGNQGSRRVAARRSFALRRPNVARGRQRMEPQEPRLQETRSGSPPPQAAAWRIAQPVLQATAAQGQLTWPARGTACREEIAVSCSAIALEQRLQYQVARPLLPARVPPVLIWRCKHAHGLFSMLSLALGHAEQCEKRGFALIVDWSDEDLLYRPPPGESNLWTAFFQQPAEAHFEPAALRDALRQGKYVETNRHDAVFGAYRGVVQDYGVIPPELAAYGRGLCKRNLALRDRFAAVLRAAAAKFLDGSPGSRWLAVHIRRSDKAVEAKANLQLTETEILERVLAQCRAWSCNAVFLCTDDAALKRTLIGKLEAAGQHVSSYPSALPVTTGQAAHFDKSIDAYRKAEDVMIEAMLMARGCHGLLSTFSNVSAVVVYLSPESFRYTTFFEKLETSLGAPLPSDQVGLLSLAAAELRGLRCWPPTENTFVC